jgi:hypothetical protein
MDFLKRIWERVSRFLVELLKQLLRLERGEDRRYWLSSQPELLPKRYNQVTFAGTHNSFSNNSSKTEAQFPYQYWVLNHTLSITEQLNTGIRVLDIDIYPEGWFRIAQDEQFRLAREWGLDRIELGNNIELFNEYLERIFDKVNANQNLLGDIREEAIAVYHGVPLFGRTSFTTLLTKIKEWVEKNPGEVVSINLTRERGMEDTDDEQQKALLNDKIKSFFVASGLDEWVSSYNIEREPDDAWPTLQEMIDAGKPVMVFGLLSAQQFNRYDNYYHPEDGGEPKEAWGAKSVDDLSPTRLHVPIKPGSCRLFLDNNFCSRRWVIDFPYLFAGNLWQAKEANRYELVKALATACESKLDEGQIVNWIWVDFFDPDDDGLLEAVRDLNASRLA